MNQMNITPQNNNSSLAQYALTQEEAFRPTKGDTNFSKTRKFAIGTTLTTTAFLAAIVETTISALLAVLTSPAYLFAPKHYAQITQHTADSAKTIMEAAKRTLGAEVKKAEAPPPQIQPTRVKKLQGLAKAYASNAIQYSKEHKLMIAVALGTATLAAAALMYYMTSTPPSNPPIPLPLKGSALKPFWETCRPGDNPEMFSYVSTPTNPPAGISLKGVSAPFVPHAAETTTSITGVSSPPTPSTTITIISPKATSTKTLQTIFTRTNPPSISSSTTSLPPGVSPPPNATNPLTDVRPTINVNAKHVQSAISRNRYNLFLEICRPGENPEVFCPKADSIPSAYSNTWTRIAIEAIVLFSVGGTAGCGCAFSLTKMFLLLRKKLKKVFIQ